MPEVRIDPLSGHRTIVAGERSKRPGGQPTCSPPEPIDAEHDPFAEGHEDRTPPELYAVRPGGGPARLAGLDGASGAEPLSGAHPGGGGRGSERRPRRSIGAGRWGSTPSREPARGRPELFTALPATGAHEVIVNGPQSVLSLAELPLEQVMAAVEVWRARMRAHAESAYLQLIVNERREAGASLPHTHAQLYGLDFVPALVARERERASAYTTRTMGGSLLGDLLAEEVRLRERIVAVDEEAVLLAPYASQLPFQLMLVPRRPRARFEDDGPVRRGAAARRPAPAGAPCWDRARR